MPTTYLSNFKLAKLDVGDTRWDIPINYNSEILNALRPIYNLMVTPRQVPSVDLQIRVTTGVYMKSDGSPATFAGGYRTLPASKHLSVYLLESSNDIAWAQSDGEGPVEDQFAAFPAVPHVPLALVVTNASLVQEYYDWRTPTGRVYYLLTNAVDDAAAAIAGVAVGCLYRTGSLVKIRVA